MLVEIYHRVFYMAFEVLKHRTLSYLLQCFVYNSAQTVELEVPARRPHTLVMIFVSECQSVLCYEQVGEDLNFILS